MYSYYIRKSGERRASDDTYAPICDALGDSVDNERRFHTPRRRHRGAGGLERRASPGGGEGRARRGRAQLPVLLLLRLRAARVLLLLDLGTAVVIAAAFFSLLLEGEVGLRRRSARRRRRGRLYLNDRHCRRRLLLSSWGASASLAALIEPFVGSSLSGGGSISFSSFRSRVWRRARSRRGHPALLLLLVERRNGGRLHPGASCSSSSALRCAQ